MTQKQKRQLMREKTKSLQLNLYDTLFGEINHLLYVINCLMASKMKKMGNEVNNHFFFQV